MKKHDIRGKAIDEDIKDRLLAAISPIEIVEIRRSKAIANPKPTYSGSSWVR